MVEGSYLRRCHRKAQGSGAGPPARSPRTPGRITRSASGRSRWDGVGDLDDVAAEGDGVEVGSGERAVVSSGGDCARRAQPAGDRANRAVLVDAPQVSPPLAATRGGPRRRLPGRPAARARQRSKAERVWSRSRAERSRRADRRPRKRLGGLQVAAALVDDKTVGRRHLGPPPMHHAVRRDAVKMRAEVVGGKHRAIGRRCHAVGPLIRTTDPR